MSIFDIRDRVEEIRDLAHDAGRAHGMEDDLHLDVLTAISRRELFGTHAAECAALALSTADIEFSRWTS